jgi:hypothetical protein
MFFSVGSSHDPRFPNNFQIGKLWINVDHGWQRNDSTFFKGYADNYCYITVDSQGLTFQHSQPRSFPLWHNHKDVTNLPCDVIKTSVWADDVITVDPQGCVQVNKSVLDLSVPQTQLSVDQALTQIRQQLDKSAHSLYKYRINNLKLFCSGGLDTFLLYALLTHHSIPFELLIDEHYEWDEFNLINNEVLQSFWSYQQIHHWHDPTWLATGSCGDEYFMRGPTVIAMLTAWHDINMIDVLNQNTQAYHYHYFNRYTDLWQSAWESRQSLQDECATREDLNQRILNNLVNDYQYWHLGNTITWTPFKNIDIAKILLQCNIRDLLPQFMDGSVTKQLIAYYKPQLLEFVSQYKNHNSQQHLEKFYNWHANQS